jgi:hypothetical protein
LAVQIHPARQPAFALHYTAHASAFAEELRSAHFIDGFVGVLQNVKLVVDDAAVPSPLFNAVGERPPHIHASRLHSFPLRGAQWRPEKLIEGFLFAVLPKPQRLAGIQV